MRGGVFPGELPESEARELIAAEPPMAGARPGARGHPERSRCCSTRGDAAGPTIVAIDTGIKDSIVRNLRERGVRLELHPCTTSAEELLARDARRRLPRQRTRRPGRARLRRRHRPRAGRQACRCSASASATSCSAGRSASRPTSCRSATAAPTTRSRTSRPGRIDITSQNHGFAVVGPDGARTIETDEPVRWDTDFGAAELSHVNLYDRTVEGLVLRDVPRRDCPVPPGGRPRPARRLYLFDRFLRMVETV